MKELFADLYQNIYMSSPIKLLKASSWTGRWWLATLCFLLVVVVTTYFVSHYRHYGTQAVQLDSKQLQALNLVLPQSDPKIPVDTAKVFKVLQNIVGASIDPGERKAISEVLATMSNKDASQYFADKKMQFASVFWLSGGMAYFDVLWWTLIGVLTSLVYYVSLANWRDLQSVGDDDSGSFNPGEISGQVAKMFYAPIIALVIVLGYHYTSGSNATMIDISAGNGLILFSFLAGFFSGRLVKFLDGLKNLVLPVSSTPPVTAGAVTVKLTLPGDVAATADGIAILQAGFKDAVVTLDAGGGAKPLQGQLVTGQNDQFRFDSVKAGNYKLSISYTYKRPDDTLLNFAAGQDVTMGPATQNFVITLTKKN